MKYKSVDQVKELLGMSKSVDIAKVLMTPAMADEILETCNIKNRNLNLNAANFLKEQFNSGDYFLSSTCIGFDNQGTLTDGQHRLWAISMCEDDKKFLIGIMFGVDQNMDMDTGRKRSLVDNAVINDDFDEKLKNDTDANICVQVANQLIWFVQGSKKVSQKHRLDICNYYADSLYNCYKMGIFNRSKNRINNTVRLALFAAYLNKVPENILRKVYTELASGEGELYDRIATLDSSGRGTKMSIYKYVQSYIHKILKGLKGKIRDDKVYYLFDLKDVPHMSSFGGELVVKN